MLQSLNLNYAGMLDTVSSRFSIVFLAIWRFHPIGETILYKKSFRFAIIMLAGNCA